MYEFLQRLGIEPINDPGSGTSDGEQRSNSGVYADDWLPGSGEVVVSYAPGTGAPIAAVRTASPAEYEQVVVSAQRSFDTWRRLPAPARGHMIREIGEVLRQHKDDLGRLVALEMGKILQEGLGEVQEVIDITDFAVGLSRQLYGFTMHSERPGHRMYEQYHPLGPIGVITAFNFPVAVYGWNSIIGATCGNAIIWKPSLKTPLCAIAVHRLLAPVAGRHGVPGLFGLVMGPDDVIGEALVQDRRLPLISATGSARMGRIVAAKVGARLGKTILELSGNNAIIITPEADLDLAILATVFGAVGTAGQRCTSTRRLIVHESLIDEVSARLTAAYQQVRVGDPLAEGTLMGPLIDDAAVTDMLAAIDQARAQGGQVLSGGERLDRPGHYVTPCLIRMSEQSDIVRDETFAPILYILPYRDLERAIDYQNGVSQGLSSAIFTRNLLEAERFLSQVGSDCGIANVNIGTSGAEIGGAFGGEKDTGGGRESGSDAWKAYMRRQTNTINYTSDLPLAQGIEFKLS